MKRLNQNNITENHVIQAHDFQEVYVLIQTHRKRAAAAIDNESLRMLWEVGGYVSQKLKSSAWGDGVVTQLSEYIRTQDSAVRGWSHRTIYKMVQFYDTYSRLEFGQLVDKMNLNHFDKPRLESADDEIVPIEMAQINETAIVPFEMAQIPNVLFATGWTNHQIIMSRCKCDEERLFYMLYANKEHLENKQLEFYMEVLDQEEKRSNENPTIGIILCKESDPDVIRYAMNRAMSPMMIMQYKEQLKVGGVIQRCLEEYCKFVNKEF